MKKSIGEIRTWLGTGAINVFGPPFSGKDTVGRRLADDLGATFLSSGAILREAEKEDEVLAAELGQGKLANTDKFRKIVLPYFDNDSLRGMPMILSSVGRWSGEEDAVMKALKSADHELKAVVCLDISKREIVQRWETAKELSDRGGRSDDTDTDVLTKRLLEFDEKTLPVLKHYEELGLLIKIDGQGTRDEVYERMIQALASIANRA